MCPILKVPKMVVRCALQDWRSFVFLLTGISRSSTITYLIDCEVVNRRTPGVVLPYWRHTIDNQSSSVALCATTDGRTDARTHAQAMPDQAVMAANGKPRNNRHLLLLLSMLTSHADIVGIAEVVIWWVCVCPCALVPFWNGLLADMCVTYVIELIA